MNAEELHELDLAHWVAAAPANQRRFRQAVHIVLMTISTSVGLRSRMIMKGGLLMAIRYDSSRFTKDIDFSTHEMWSSADQEALLAELEAQLEWTNQQLPYDIVCRLQGAILSPANQVGSFPALKLSIGYASRSNPSHMARLKAGMSPDVVKIDHSYNEAVYDVEVLSLQGGEQLQTYGLCNLIAEKYRALLQQPLRHRNRRQDVYDLYLLLCRCAPLSDHERMQIAGYILKSCASRGIEANPRSISDAQIKAMAASEYAGLADDIGDDLPAFEESFARIESFYLELPW